MKSRHHHIYIITAIFSIISSCSLFMEPESSAESLCEEGWAKFEKRNYESALSKFSDAISTDANYDEGYHGRGWCNLLLNNASNAIDDFNTAKSKGNNTIDLKCGLAAAHLADENFQEAISNANQVIEINPNYFFEHERLINYLDIRLILAMAYFHEGQLSKAQEQVNFLYPSNQLDPNTSNTWVVNGVTHPSYAEALMAYIDLLDVQYGM